MAVFTACEDEYHPDLVKYENLLVVDGLLTNGNDPVTVKLSVATAVYDKAYIPLSGADLHVTDQNSEVISLTEIESGTYKPADTSWRAIPGNSYQLHITLPDGRKYVSAETELNPSIPIDAVYGIEEDPELGETDHQYPGLQFYVENHANTTDTLYYLWRLSQTYQFQSSFTIDYIWAGAYMPYPNPDSLHTCWKTENITQTLYGSTQYLDPTAVNRFPLHFVSTDTKELSIRYCLMVKQLNIPRDTWQFLNAIEQQNLDQGDLWSRQPIQIRGNIFREDQEDEPVLGYFIVAGETKKRIFLGRPDLPFYYTECIPDPDLRWVPHEPANRWPVYLVLLPTGVLCVADQDFCFDCRLLGGNIDPPDFWVE